MAPTAKSSSSSSKAASSSRRHPRYRPPCSSTSSSSSSRPKKDLTFGPVEVIVDASTPKHSRHGGGGGGGGGSGGSSSSKLRTTGGKLRRSPTPVLTSLTELANAHLTQLETVWKESNLPGFEADKKAIAATRDGMIDPFDF